MRGSLTVLQLLTVLDESDHTLTIIEHDPLHFESTEGMVEYIFLARREAAKSSIMLLYILPQINTLDRYPEKMTYANRLFCFAKGPSAALHPSARS